MQDTGLAEIRQGVSDVVLQPTTAPEVRAGSDGDSIAMQQTVWMVP